MTDGSITIHKPELCRELIGPGEEVRDGEVEGTASRQSQPSSRQDTSSPTRAPSRARMARIEEWLNQKARRAVVALPDDPQLTEMVGKCQEMQEREEEFFSELDAFLAGQEEESRCKREMLYRKWSDRVFQPIHTQLGSEVNSQAENHRNRRRQAFDGYLTYQNNKTVFLDTISTEDYDPMQQTHSTQMTTGRLDDPLVSQAADHCSEQLVITGCEQGLPPPDVLPPPTLGRGDTDAVLWPAMQLVHIDSEARTHSRARMSGTRNESSGDNGGCLQLPHKTKIIYSRQPLRLDWAQRAHTQRTPDSPTQ